MIARAVWSVCSQLFTAAGRWFQVCEKMGDSGQASRGSLARALGCALERTRWAEKHTSHLMRQALYSLPKHLRRVVLQAIRLSEYHDLVWLPLWLQHVRRQLQTACVPHGTCHGMKCSVYKRTTRGSCTLVLWVCATVCIRCGHDGLRLGYIR